MASEAAKAESAAAAAAEAAAVWQEVLMQTEEDLELQAERDGDRLATARHEAGEVRTAMAGCDQGDAMFPVPAPRGYIVTALQAC